MISIIIMSVIHFCPLFVGYLGRNLALMTSNVQVIRVWLLGIDLIGKTSLVDCLEGKPFRDSLPVDGAYTFSQYYRRLGVNGPAERPKPASIVPDGLYRIQLWTHNGFVRNDEIVEAILRSHDRPGVNVIYYIFAFAVNESLEKQMKWAEKVLKPGNDFGSIPFLERTMIFLNKTDLPQHEWRFTVEDLERKMKQINPDLDVPDGIPIKLVTCRTVPSTVQNAFEECFQNAMVKEYQRVGPTAPTPPPKVIPPNNTNTGNRGYLSRILGRNDSKQSIPSHIQQEAEKQAKDEERKRKEEIRRREKEREIKERINQAVIKEEERRNKIQKHLIALFQAATLFGGTEKWEVYQQVLRQLQDLVQESVTASVTPPILPSYTVIESGNTHKQRLTPLVVDLQGIMKMELVNHLLLSGKRQYLEVIIAKNQVTRGSITPVNHENITPSSTTTIAMSSLAATVSNRPLYPFHYNLPLLVSTASATDGLIQLVRDLEETERQSGIPKICFFTTFAYCSSMPSNNTPSKTCLSHWLEKEIVQNNKLMESKLQARMDALIEARSRELMERQRLINQMRRFLFG